MKCIETDSGFIEFNAALLLFFIAIIISGGVLYTTAAMTHLQTTTRDFDDKAAADSMLNEIIAKMQPLRLYPYDNAHNEIITSLCGEYAAYGLEFTDISSGYHLDFLSDADMADSGLTEYLFLDGTGNAFAAWRNINGLSATKDPWKVFVKEDAWGACVTSGWINIHDTESYAFRYISRVFAVSAGEKLFPLVNEFPRINVNMVNPDILRPLIMRNSFKLDKPEEKVAIFINKLKSGPMLQADIQAVLKIPASHPLLGYLGSKTAFWSIRFAMPSSLTVIAVAAAIPKKNGAAQEIEEYRLIDRRFTNGNFADD
ncbi:MAG: hypothetical protein FWF29_12310 [Treponema sp.]|nr:hypothetical protein [Treponema sp.]